MVSGWTAESDHIPVILYWLLSAIYLALISDDGLYLRDVDLNPVLCLDTGICKCLCIGEPPRCLQTLITSRPMSFALYPINAEATSPHTRRSSLASRSRFGCHRHYAVHHGPRHTPPLPHCRYHGTHHGRVHGERQPRMLHTCSMPDGIR